MRLRDKVAIVVGAGQTPGDTIGNGRATAILFAREGGRCFPFQADVTREEDFRAARSGQAPTPSRSRFGNTL
jgi:NAD(P)-dependent dehydrogenase (short-subunit alcohol dehydrogenase family)